MKYIIALFLIIASPLFSQTLMWEVEDNNSKIYVLGSIHIADSTAYPLAPVIEKAYNNSESIAVEVNIDQADFSLMQQKMYLPQGESLSDQMDQKTYDKLVDKLANANVPPQYYTQMKPWAAIFSVMNAKMAQIGYSSEFGIDKYFIKKAIGDSKDIKELETMEFQISMFDKFDDNPSDYLEYSLNSLDSTSYYIKQLYGAWKNADTNSLRKMLDMGKDEYPDYEKISKSFLDDRNINMVNKIEMYLRDEKATFVIVGAGHLLGENGIVQLLKNKGYKVTQK